MQDRIINLEIKFSHQEDFIQQLNDVVVAQQLTIGRMEKEILDLQRAIHSGHGVQISKNQQDEKPPHY